MAKLKKSRQKRDLFGVDTLITDETRNSPDLFDIQQLGDELGIGKNGFIIGGTDKLSFGSNVLIEITDQNGEVIYHEVSEYLEANSRLVSIFVYEGTPPGQARITVLSEVEEDLQGNPIPEEWEDRFNAKWTRKIKVNPDKFNTSKIRFERSPEAIASVDTYTTKEPKFGSKLSSFRRIGDRSYIPEGPRYEEAFESYSTFPIYISDQTERPEVEMKFYPSEWIYDYFNIVANNFTWEESMEGELLFISSQGKNYTDFSGNEFTLEQQLPLENDMVGEITKVVSDDVARFRLLTDSYLDYPEKFEIDTERFFLVYERENQFYEDKELAYFSDLQLGNIKTLSGEVARVRVYSKLRGGNETFTFEADYELEPVNLLRDDRTDRRNLFDPIGDIDDQDHIDRFFDSDPNTDILFNEDILKNSLEITPSTFGEDSYLTSINLSTDDALNFTFFEYAEYTLRYEIVFESKDGGSYTSTFNVYGNGEPFENTRKKIDEVTVNEENYLIEERSSNFFPRKTSEVKPSSGDPFKLEFEIDAPDTMDDWSWFIRNLRLEPAQSIGFSPDYTILKNPVDLNQYDPSDVGDLIYKFDLFDLNGNKAGISLQTNR